MKTLSRRSRSVNFAFGLPNSKLPTFSEGGKPAKKISRIADQQCRFDRFANYSKQTLDSRLRGNDEVFFAAKEIPHVA